MAEIKYLDKEGLKVVFRNIKTFTDATYAKKEEDGGGEGDTVTLYTFSASDFIFN